MQERTDSTDGERQTNGCAEPERGKSSEGRYDNGRDRRFRGKRGARTGRSTRAQAV